MRESPFSTDRFFRSACLFEAALILVAIVLGWIADINPFANLHFSEAHVFYGILGTIPLFLLFLAFQQMTVESVVSIRKLLLNTLAPGLARCSWADLLLLSVIAGVSEEVLFRGLLQPWLENAWGMRAGLIGSNVIFGLVHAITPLYTVLATLVGIFLGWTLDYGGTRNLLTPIVIHGLYDFLALLLLMRSFKQNQHENFTA